MDAKAAHKAPGEEDRKAPSNTVIIRVDKSAGHWDAIPRDLIDDERLSLEARAAAMWFLSRPKDWEIRPAAMPFLLKDATRCSGHVGRDFAKRMLRELDLCGYLTRKQTRTPTGRWCWEYVFNPAPAGTIDGLTVDGSPVDRVAVDGKGVDIQQTDKSTPIQFTPTTTTDPPEANGARQPDVRVPSELRYPGCLGGERLAAARAIIETCPAEQRQAVLDEMDVMHAARRVRSPLGLLHRLAERANKAEFFPNLSARVSRPRPPMNARRATSETRGKPPADGAAVCSAESSQSVM